MAVKLNPSADGFSLRVEAEAGDLANLQTASPQNPIDVATKEYVDQHVPEDVVTNEVLEQKLQEVVGTPGFTGVRYITTNNHLTSDYAWVTKADDTPYEDWVDIVDPKRIPDYNLDSDLVFLYMSLTPNSNTKISSGWKWKFALGFVGDEELEVHVVADDFELKNKNGSKVIKAVTIPIITHNGFKRKLLSVKGIFYNQLGTYARLDSYMYVYSPG